MTDQEEISGSETQENTQGSKPGSMESLQPSQDKESVTQASPIENQLPGKLIEPFLPGVIHPGINDQPEPSTMEVHHHPHMHYQKKWKEYLFQFLMLFLAVFCGFLAEWILEQRIEHHREKQFIQSLVNDIRADTARLNNIINTRSSRELRMDTLTFLLNDKHYASQTNDIYHHAITIPRTISFRFTPNDGTMQQLKNSGGLRLIRNRIVRDSISQYDVAVRNMVDLGNLEETVLLDYRETAVKIFNALVFEKMTDTNNNMNKPADNPFLLDFTSANLNEFNFRLFTVKSLNKAIRRDMRSLLKEATNLLTTLSKEYHLD
jgi:hypothetical protein